MTWPPEMFAPTATATNRAKPWAMEAEMRPAGVVAPLLVSLLKAMLEPEPAKTKMRVDMNSANAAFKVSGCVASSGLPTAMFLTGILWGVLREQRVQEERAPVSTSHFSARGESEGCLSFILRVTRLTKQAIAGSGKSRKKK